MDDFVRENRDHPGAEDVAKLLQELARGEDPEIADGMGDVGKSLRRIADELRRARVAFARAAELERALERVVSELSETEKIARIGNWRWDIPTNAVEWSLGLCELYGIKPDDFGRSYEAFLAYVHPDDVARVRSAIETAWKGGKAFEFDHRIIRTDGRELTLHAKGSVIFDDAGNVIGMVGTGQDVTANRQLIEEMRKNALELERMNKLMVGRELRMVELKDALAASKKGNV